MKKILTLVCCTILLAATSCTKKYITPTNRTVFFFIPKTTGWVLSPDDNVSYQTTLGSANNPLPELDQYTHANGGILVYFSYDGKKQVYEALPETYNGVSYSYVYSENHITIYAQGVNGTKLPAPPGDDVDVKVVLVDSEPQN